MVLLLGTRQVALFPGNFRRPNDKQKYHACCARRDAYSLTRWRHSLCCLPVFDPGPLPARKVRTFSSALLAPGRLWCCCMATRKPVTHGLRWRPNSLRLTRLWCRICGALGDRRVRPAATDKKTQAADIRAVVTGLGYDRASVVSHDIGIMVAYAYAALYPDKVERLVVMDAPIPGIAPWDDIVRNPALWHFSFNGPDAERLVQGRERIYLDRIWNAFSWKSDPYRITLRAHSTRSSMRSQERCGRALRSLRLSRKTWKTTKSCSEPN